MGHQAPVPFARYSIGTDETEHPQFSRERRSRYRCVVPTLTESWMLGSFIISRSYAFPFVGNADLRSLLIKQASMILATQVKLREKPLSTHCVIKLKEEHFQKGLKKCNGLLFRMSAV